MKKLFFYVGLASLLCFSSCNSETEEILKNTSKTEVSNLVNTNRLSSEFENVIEIGNQQFVPKGDGSVDLYLEDIYQGNISLLEPNYEVIDNSEATGEIIVKNNSSDLNETLIIRNLREFDDYLMFDMVLSTGNTITDVRMNNYARGAGGGIWGVIAGAIVEAVVSAIFDSNNDGDLSHAECTKAFQAVKCQGGKNPYMNYSTGNWFTSPHCSVGCK